MASGVRFGSRGGQDRGEAVPVAWLMWASTASTRRWLSPVSWMSRRTGFPGTGPP